MNKIYLPDGVDAGQVSDGWHTFDELYNHRTVLFINLMKAHRDISWKSRKHSDGSMFEGDWFVAGMNLPTGQITYHLEGIWWESCMVEELLFAPEWDCHSPQDVVERLKRWINIHTIKEFKGKR